MRVSIKVSVAKRKHPQYSGERAGLAVRHNLDLYNDVQVEKFIRRAAEKLEVGTIGLSTAIDDISTQLEGYRITQLSFKEIKKIYNLRMKKREETLAFSIEVLSSCHINHKYK